MSISKVTFLGQRFYQDPQLAIGKVTTDSVVKSVVNKLAPTGLMTPVEAAQYLGIEASTLQVWRSTNRKVLSYVKVGRSVRYRREDLEKFITANLCNA